MYSKFEQISANSTVITHLLKLLKPIRTIKKYLELPFAVKMKKKMLRILKVHTVIKLAPS